MIQAGIANYRDIIYDKKEEKQKAQVCGHNSMHFNIVNGL